MYEIQINFTTGDLAILQSVLNVLESKDIDYSVNFKRCRQDKIQIDDRFLKKHPETEEVKPNDLSVLDKGIDNVLKTNEWKNGDRFTSVIDTGDIVVPDSSGSIIFINYEESIALVQFDNENISLGYLPLDYDLKQFPNLSLDRKITFKELRKLVK